MGRYKALQNDYRTVPLLGSSYSFAANTTDGICCNLQDFYVFLAFIRLWSGAKDD